MPPAASVPHLQLALDSMARLEPRPGPALLPWALQELPHGSTVLLAASDIAPELERSIVQLETTGFHVLVLLAINQVARGYRRPGTITLTPGCDLAARLEGRG